MIVDTASAGATMLLAAVVVNPEDSKAPGINALKDLVNGLAAYAVVAAVAAVLLGGMAWALGERMGMDRASSVGKSGVLAGFGLAFLVGAAAALVNFFLATGSTASSGTPDSGTDTNGQRPPAVVQLVDPPAGEHDEPSAYS
ncbi:hypothetical protein I6A84_23925 [Frankia sp. CNm7]|uniref:Integral membrane protein n=1 Tax=Frankia nepalensis TaxID=1836974 RepID=A0A937RLF5_9ACTN|nr:DUF6112 family protein [Frankia nepalensis]MBL7496766.1 hypothetical protein [Frankia nepalensis]MBL7516285.1 hypothetical protein [Frankia nepalensis]MBL7521053.1 hypothetical protein [Frankia nepalensis]MBL7630994.1 hypothetical protein [Frankia nepalensis]